MIAQKEWVNVTALRLVIVFVKMSRERASAHHSMLVCEWEGPYKVTKSSENTALVTKICENEEPLRVQLDLLLRCPSMISDEPITTETGRKKGVKKRVNSVWQGVSTE